MKRGPQSLESLVVRWARLKARATELRRRERCEGEERACDGYEAVPPCWYDRDNLTFVEWCGPCQRNQARYLYLVFTRKAIRSAERAMRAAAKALAA